MNTTKEDQLADLESAQWILDRQREHFEAGGLLLVSTDYGTGLTDYLKVSAVITENGRQIALSLTWAMAKVFGYRLRDRNGYWHLAVSGYGYSKEDQLARELANYYGLARILHTTI